MADADEVALLPVPCLVVLVGASGSGKSTWAATHFEADEVVSSDRLRAVVGRGEDDLDATDDAFAMLDTIVAARLGRRLTTVVDTLGLDDDRRAAYRRVAADHEVPCFAVGFDISAPECRARNRQRAHPRPAPTLTRQLTRWTEVRAQLGDEGFAGVLEPVPVRHVPEHLAASASASASPGGEVAAAPRRAASPDGPAVRFGLHVSAFPWDDIGTGLRATAAAAEAAGFASLWVMDHVRQIPQVGRDWDPMLESYTTLGWLAAATSTIELGVLVTAVTFRNIGHLAKIVATLDVLSGGRARCGIGLGWYEREHVAYAWDFPSTGERYDLLGDALVALPVLWGPGSKPFAGRVLTLPETICYPRPLQTRIPILLGGGGERRTLRLAARHADAVNVMGPLDVVAHKVEVLRRHCADVDRDPTEIAVTHLAPTLVGGDRRELTALVDGLRPRQADPARFAAQMNAGTVADQIDRVRALAGAGVDEVIVSLPDLGVDAAQGIAAEGPIERFGRVIAAFT